MVGFSQWWPWAGVGSRVGSGEPGHLRHRNPRPTPEDRADKGHLLIGTQMLLGLTAEAEGPGVKGWGLQPLVMLQKHPPELLHISL